MLSLIIKEIWKHIKEIESHIVFIYFNSSSDNGRENPPSSRGISAIDIASNRLESKSIDLILFLKTLIRSYVVIIPMISLFS